MTDNDRRAVLAAGAALTGAAFLPPAPARAQEAPRLDPMPPLPATRTPGKPGDFDFLTGEWRIQQQRRLASGVWDVFEGEATVHAILAGVCSVEELRIPARNFSGMGLRLLDVENKVWSDHWVNAQSGVVSVPGQLGSFENGAGIFTSEDVLDGRPVIYAGVWDQIGPGRCRWRQASSLDGGKTWDQVWIMNWSRVA